MMTTAHSHMKVRLSSLFLALLLVYSFATAISAAELRAGPMAGASAMRAVKLWLQADGLLGSAGAGPQQAKDAVLDGRSNPTNPDNCIDRADKRSGLVEIVDALLHALCLLRLLLGPWHRFLRSTAQTDSVCE